MRALTMACLSLLCLAWGGQAANAQTGIGDLPPEFFGAQRGRAVARPHGGFRVRYGRGLTPGGADVLTTAIGTLGPLLPSIISPMGAPMYVPADPGADPAHGQPDFAPACEPLADDPVLDALVDSAAHSGRIKNLDQMSATMTRLVTCLGGKPVQPKPQPKPQPAIGDGGAAGGGGGAVQVVGGGVIDPQASPPTPAVLPEPATGNCVFSGDAGAPKDPKPPTGPPPTVAGKAGTDEQPTPPTPLQILQQLRAVDARLASGETLAEALKSQRIDDRVYQRWQRRFGDIISDEAERLSELRSDNERLKKLLAEAELEKSKLKQALQEGN